MSFNYFKEPKRITIGGNKNEDTGEVVGGKEYIIHKWSALAGRELITQFPTSALPVIGNYKLNEKYCLELMKYVQAVVKDSGQEHLIRLDDFAKVDSHIENFKCLMELEKECIFYNCGFFPQGGILNSLIGLIKKHLPQISKTLMGLLPQLSQIKKQPSES